MLALLLYVKNEIRAVKKGKACLRFVPANRSVGLFEGSGQKISEGYWSVGVLEWGDYGVQGLLLKWLQ